MGKRITLGVTGSIAAYKACDLVRLLVKRGDDVRVVMTRAATQFVTPLTFQTLSQNPVAVEMFGEKMDWEPEHIALADADCVVVAPATADILAKAALGIADDMLSATLCATRAPILFAPAMNSGMWENPAVQANIVTLEARGVQFIEPEQGELACGTIGKGRMASPETILKAL